MVCGRVCMLEVVGKSRLDVDTDTPSSRVILDDDEHIDNDGRARCLLIVCIPHTPSRTQKGSIRNISGERKHARTRVIKPILTSGSTRELR